MKSKYIFNCNNSQCNRRCITQLSILSLIHITGCILINLQNLYYFLPNTHFFLLIILNLLTKMTQSRSSYCASCRGKARKPNNVISNKAKYGTLSVLVNYLV